MSNLARLQQFQDNGNNKRESEDFQGYLFHKIDLRLRETPISFYRSDFRGAKLQDTYFIQNNFSNADFIDSTAINTVFEKCQFKSTELYNSYFEKCLFKTANINSSSLVKLIFVKCNFESVKFNNDTISKCKYENCNFIESKFEKSSIDDVDFLNCTLKDIDLSSNTAINLFFDKCRFENVVIDADYLGSYFFKGFFFDNLKLKYRGKVFDLDITQSDLLSNLFKMFFEKERYYEAINICIQKNLLEQKQNTIFPLLKNVVDKLLREGNQLKRTYQFGKIFTLLEYYLNTGYVSVDDYFKAIALFVGIDVTHFDFLEQIEFNERVSRLKIIIEKIDFELPFIKSSNAKEKVLFEIKIEEANKNKFEKYFDASVYELADKLSITDVPYQIIGCRKGSIIYDMLIYPTVGLYLLKLLKSYLKEARATMHESIHIAIDYKTDVRLLSESKNIKTKNQIKKIKEIKEVQILSRKAIGKGQSETGEIKKLLPLIKSAIIYPNALPKGKN